MSKLQLRKQAEGLRDRGYSYPMIASALNLSKSTLSVWLRERPYNPNKDVVERIKYGPIKSAGIRHQKKVNSISEFHKIGIDEIGLLSKRDLFLLGVGLYIGEGSKSTDTVRIVNSDPDTIRLAMSWFRSLGLGNENFSARLHLYPDNSERKSINFWKNICGLKDVNFRKSYIDVRQNKMNQNRNKLPYGTIHINILSNGNRDLGVTLFRRIQGWMLGVFGNI